MLLPKGIQPSPGWTSGFSFTLPAAPVLWSIVASEHRSSCPGFGMGLSECVSRCLPSGKEP